jgi:hypothetical protein
MSEPNLQETLKDVWAAIRATVPTSTRRTLEERHPWLREVPTSKEA